MKEKKQGTEKERSRSSKQADKLDTVAPGRNRDETLPRLTGSRPELMQPDEILALQRTVGNRLVSDLLQRSITGSSVPARFIQRVDEEEDTGGEGSPAGDGERAAELFQEGLALIRQGQYRQAIIRLERTRQANPGLRNTYWNIAECNWALGRNATAIIYYERYMTMPGADTEAAQARLREVRRLAGVAEETPITPQPAEEPEGAVPGADESGAPSEETAPAPGGEERARGLFQEGLALIRQGQYRQAIIRLERARQANPSLRNTYWNIAECNWAIGRNATAIIYYEQYSTMSGADTEAAQARLREVRRLAGVVEETPVAPQPAEEPEGAVPHIEASAAPSEEAAQAL